ncbi:hypothetical protein [Halobacterium hubeiense]|uniref:hypothetical protein n=1 Tax=Halobacterium hubeiense TaxID=1407499 RepID=UPI00117A0535|nr:hypothetical protein [Halobacterium hubeiense]
MTEGALVNVLGMVAGTVWMSAALYFQLIRPERVHPGFVSALFLIGVALMLGSSAVTITGRPSFVETLAIAGNGLFILIGLGAWYTLERYADLQALKDHTNETRDTH